MASFGEILKRERELRAITLREISAATKISVRHLESLENNRFQDLPGGLFNKGFIRAYASYVGIDCDEMVNHYLYEMDQQQTDKDPLADLKALLPPQENKSSRQTRQWVILCAILLGGIALFTVLRMSLKVPEEGATAAPPPDRESPVLGAAFSDLSTGTFPLPDSQPPPIPGPQTAPEEEAGSVAEPAPVPAFTEPKPDPGISKEVKFRFKMVRPARVRILCDGTEVLDKYLESGERRSYRCRDLRLSTPDAGALQYSLNRSGWHTPGPSGTPLEGMRLPPRDAALEGSGSTPAKSG